MPGLFDLLYPLSPALTPTPATTVPLPAGPGVPDAMPLPTTEDELMQMLWQRQMLEADAAAQANTGNLYDPAIRQNFPVGSGLTQLAPNPALDPLVAEQAIRALLPGAQSSGMTPAVPGIVPQSALVSEPSAASTPQIPQPGAINPFTREAVQQTPSSSQPGLYSLLTPEAPRGDLAGPQVAQVGPAASPEIHQQRVSGWTKLLQSLKDPNVYEPLQTFFAALSAPLASWESTGSRIGRANMLMQTHKQYLAENAKNQPREAELKDIELRSKRAGLKSAEAKGSVDEATIQSDIDAEMLKVENLRRDGRLNDARILEQEVENKYADEYYKWRNVKMRRDANAPYYKPTDNQDDDDTRDDKARAKLETYYETQIWGPYLAWARETREEAADAEFAGVAGAAAPPKITWKDFIDAKPEIAARYGQWQKAWKNASGREGIRHENAWKQQLIGPAATTTQTPAKATFEVGKVYIDKNGSRAKYLGNGKWEGVK